jgi:hypothetical protein
MTNVLMVTVLGTIALALAIDIAALVGLLWRKAVRDA